MRRQNTTKALLLACLLCITSSLTIVPPPPAGAATATPLAVYPLGDSITLGYTPTTPTPGGYRSVLSAALDRADVAHRMVGASTANPSPTLSQEDQTRHDGHGGYRIDQVAANLDGVAGAYDDQGGHWLTGTSFRDPIVPDVVLVHLGTNDLVQRYDPANTYDDDEPLDEASERARFVASMSDRLDGLIDELETLRPDATLFVSTIIPMDIGSSMAKAVSDYAAAVRTIVSDQRAQGHHVVLVDAYKAFLTNGKPTAGLLSSDKVHPTAAGYAVLGRLFSDSIQASI